MKRPLQLSQRSEGAQQVVVVEGEVDMESSPRLLAELQHTLRRGIAPVVELAGVTYFDSSGVAVLVEGLKLARKRKLDFRLRDPSRPVVAVLELAGLSAMFAIDHTGKGGAPAGERKDG